MASAQKLLVVAIDFGTTYSGYAFSFYHEYMSDKNKVSTYLWPTGIGSEQSVKAPTSILFDQRKRFHSFGYQAEDTYTKLRDDIRKQCYYFKRFKMTLFKNENLTENTMVKDVSGREMRAMDVFSAGISYLRSHFQDLLQERTLEIVGEEDIQWVLTVPAIWNDTAKQFMRKAAVMAGINGDRLTLALEPEAAALYCKFSLRQGTFPIGHTFMIVDSGGGTVDVTVHKVHLSGKLQEVLPPSGGPWGGTKVDDAFQMFLVKVFGIAAIRKMSKDENLQVEREFEIVKRSFNPRATMSAVNIWVPYCLRESLDTTTLQQHSIRIRGDKISIPHQTFASFFHGSVQKIEDHVRKLMDKPEMSSTNDIYLVGGLSDSKLLQTAIKDAFPHIQVHVPVEANSAVLKGAVIFGHDSDIIGWRIAPLTYGISCVYSFDHYKHPRHKLQIIEGKEYCSDIFSKFITKDTSLKNGQATPYQQFSPVQKYQTELLVKVVTSPSSDPTYTTDLGCHVLGTIRVRMPDLTGGTTRHVKVRMIMGGTELKVEAVDGNTGVEYKATFDCF